MICWLWDACVSCEGVTAYVCPFPTPHCLSACESQSQYFLFDVDQSSFEFPQDFCAWKFFCLEFDFDAWNQFALNISFDASRSFCLAISCNQYFAWDFDAWKQWSASVSPLMLENHARCIITHCFTSAAYIFSNGCNTVSCVVKHCRLSELCLSVTVEGGEMCLSVKVECECVGLNSLLSGLSSWPCPRYFEKKKNVSNNVIAVILNRSKYIKV